MMTMIYKKRCAQVLQRRKVKLLLLWRKKRKTASLPKFKAVISELSIRGNEINE